MRRSQLELGCAGSGVLAARGTSLQPQQSADDLGFELRGANVEES